MYQVCAVVYVVAVWAGGNQGSVGSRCVDGGCREECVVSVVTSPVNSIPKGGNVRGDGGESRRVRRATDWAGSCCYCSDGSFERCAAVGGSSAPCLNCKCPLSLCSTTGSASLWVMTDGDAPPGRDKSGPYAPPIIALLDNFPSKRTYSF
jgi:hypothetical protein